MDRDALIDPEWQPVWAAAQAIPAESMAWDNVHIFIDALQNLARQKGDERSGRRLQCLLDDLHQGLDLVIAKHVPGAQVKAWDASSVLDVSEAVAHLELVCNAAHALRKAYGDMDDEAILAVKPQLVALSQSAGSMFAASSSGEKEAALEVNKNNAETDSDHEPPQPRGVAAEFAIKEDEKVEVDESNDGVLPAALIGTDGPAQEVASTSIALQEEVQAEPPQGGEALLPEAEVSFEEFSQHVWIDIRGSCVRAPWLAEEFDEKIGRNLEHTFVERRWARVWLFAEAARLRFGGALLEPQDAEAAAMLKTVKKVVVLPHSDWRRSRVFEESAKQGPLDRALLTVALHALRPGGVDGEVLSYAQADTLQDRLEDSCGPDMAEVLAYLLKLPAQNAHPMERLLDWGKRPGSTSENKVAPVERLAIARENFRGWMAKHWQAAGGRLQQTHCRHAWAIIVKSLLAPLTEDFYPRSDTQDYLNWDLPKLQKQVDRLLEDGHKIADKREVMDGDRSRINRTMEHAHELAQQLVRLATEARRPEAVQASIGFDMPEDSLRRLFYSTPSDPVCALIHELLRQDTEISDAETEEESHPFRFTAADIGEHPDLLAQIGGHSFETLVVRQKFAEKNRKTEVSEVRPILAADATTVRDPVRAAAILLEPPLLDIRADEPWVEVAEMLRNHLLQGPREDLLLSMQSGGVITADDASAIRSRQTNRLAGVATKRAKLLCLEREMTDMNLPAAEQIKRARETLDQRTASSAAVQPSDEAALVLEHWAARLIDEAIRLIELRKAWLGYRIQTQVSETDRKSVQSALNEGRYAEVLRRLSLPSQDLHAEGHGGDLRVIPWRRRGRSEFDAPKVIKEAWGSSDPALAALCKIWSDCRGKDRELRQTFYAFICQEGVADPTATNVAIRSLENNAVLVHTSKIIDRLTAQGRNPTFLPQLRGFTELELRVHQSSGVQDEAGKLAGEFAAQFEANHWIVILSPGLSDERRATLLKKFRSQRAPVALVDDIDLCRLIEGANRGSLFVGLMEIVLEQIDWRNKSPFRLADGQFIQLDMFVGRADDARLLAEQSTYTRVFAGRRLGKSALLRYLELNRNNTKLPSGQTLRVIYLMAANEQESRVVANILSRVRDTTGFVCSSATEALGDPADKLTQAMQEFAEARPDDNLLVLLDEADFFVEDQIRQYEKQHRKEACLSFKMKIIAGQATDRNGEPRVRFLLAGYRLTNKREGVWLNFGDAMELNLLRDIDAQNLIAGPLARMGVNAQDLAPVIAFRCGFQPAVILRFGNCLVEKLADERGRDLTVTADDVHTVLEDRRLEDEIRAVILNNFQDDNVGNIVFTALLIAFQQSGSGGCLPDVEIADAVLSVISGIETDLSWLTQINADHQAHIRSCLRSFETRKLLSQIEERLPGERTRKLWSLRFPHFLSIMLKPADEDIETRLRKLIAATREGGGGSSAITGLIPGSTMDELRNFLQSDPDMTRESLRGRTVCSPWHMCLVDQPNSLLDRLEGSLDEIQHQNWHNIAVPATLQTRLAVHVSAGAADAWNSNAAPDQRPVFFGGLDLLRWTLGQEGWQATGLRRLSLPYITWWFERARAWHFQGVNTPARRIWEVTSGIPFLIGKVDKMLGKPFGGNVTSAEFEAALKHLNDQLPVYANELIAGSDETRLTARECEILRMCCRLTVFGPKLNLSRELGADWTAVRDDLGMSHVAPLYTDRSDGAAIWLLQLGGFLPTEDNDEIYLSSDDVLIKLVDRLPPS